MAKHGDVWKSRCGMMELRCGDYREVLAGVHCDAVITDPPYSDRTHSGHDAGGRDGSTRRELSYTNWGELEIADFCGVMATACVGWFVALSDSELCAPWRSSLEDVGLTGFQPIPCVIPGMTVRMAGDGPSSWAVYANVARPKSLHRWGTLPGAYRTPPGVRGHIGGKPLALMTALVRDYSRKGDLICDPCAGGGTTLLAAAQEDRRAIGAEIDPDTFELAVARLEKGYTPDMFAGVSP